MKRQIELVLVDDYLEYADSDHSSWGWHLSGGALILEHTDRSAVVLEIRVYPLRWVRSFHVHPLGD